MIERNKVKLTQSGSSYLVARISPKTLGFSPTHVLCPIPSRKHHTAPYPVPKSITIGTIDSAEIGAKLTPGPFAMVIKNKTMESLVCVRADRGWHRWNFIEFITRRDGVEVRIDFEGRTPLKQAREHVDVFLLPAEPGESSLALLARGMKQLYPAAGKKPSDTPAWWHRSIYCGWGDQVAISLEMEGLGEESRALAYCIQGLYERWVRRLEQAEVPIGTIIIDAGWSPAGVLYPNTVQWPDMRGFIDRQHEKGRRVLLWLGTWMAEGLPDKWCVFAGKTRLVADPTNSGYRAFLKEHIHRLLSDGRGCFNADGFKIDQLQHIPNERQPRRAERFEKSFLLEGRHPKLKLAGTKWGCELLHQLQKDIYTAAKSAKSDALVTSSTAHPYFYDTLDMIRLHDTVSVETDVFAAMKARADLTHAALPDILIDTDNWILGDYQKWMNYTIHSHHLGVPCIFYAERYVQAMNEAAETFIVPLKDLRRIGRNWRKTCG